MMLSLIEITCPHCGVQGQILLPPLGAIIVGPCPECGETVAIYCGRVLPLDRAIMESSDQEARRAHLMDVLGTYLKGRVDRLFENESEHESSASEASQTALDAFMLDDIEDELEASDASKIVPYGEGPGTPISSEEVASFRNVDLKLLDNGDYFRAVFKRV